MNLLLAFEPNRVISRSQVRLLGAAWLGSFFAVWALSRFEVLPTPWQVVNAVPALLRQGLVGHLAASLSSSLAALAW